MKGAKCLSKVPVSCSEGISQLSWASSAPNRFFSSVVLWFWYLHRVCPKNPQKNSTMGLPKCW